VKRVQIFCIRGSQTAIGGDESYGRVPQANLLRPRRKIAGKSRKKRVDLGKVPKSLYRIRIKPLGIFAVTFEEIILTLIFGKGT